MTVEVLNIEETGPDYLQLQNDSKTVRITFADDETFTKEDSAWFFRGLKGKPAAIPLEGPFFIAVDFFVSAFDGSMKVIPFKFAIASVETL
jgi:hypothetical protein